MNITVLGTGKMARAIANRMIAGKNNVTFFSRDPEKATDMVQDLAKSAPQGTAVKVARLGSTIVDPVVINTISYANSLDVIKNSAADVMFENSPVNTQTGQPAIAPSRRHAKPFLPSTPC